MSTKNHTVDTDEIDLREIFYTLSHYKSSIVLIAVVFTLLAAVFAYFKPSIYMASSTVEVGLEDRYSNYGGQDIVGMAMAPGAASTDTEIEIIKSRFLVAQALQSVDFTHRYYTTVRYKELELYKDSSFDVNLTRGHNISFTILPYNETSFRLEAKGFDSVSKLEWSYGKVHTYFEEIDEKNFALTVNLKKGQSLQNSNYRFVVLDQESAILSAQGGVSAALVGKFSNIIEISCSDNVPLRAQEFTNALSQAYIAQSIYKKTREAAKTLSFVNAQLQQINDNLKNSAVNLENFKKETNTVNLDTKAQGAMERLNDIETKLSVINIDLGILNSLYEQVRKGKDLETISVSGLSSNNDQAGSNALTGLIGELQQAVMKVKILRADYTEEYPEVVKLRRQIDQMQKIIIDMIRNIKKNHDERRKFLEKSIYEQQQLLDKLPEAERVYGGLQRKFVVNEKIYSYLLEKQAATAIAEASTVSKNRIIDTALYPEYPIKPKRQLIVLVGLILGFILGIAQAFLRNFLDDTIKNDEDIKRGTDIPQIGIIPKFGKEGETPMVFESPKSAAAEAFRNIRTNLQFMAPNRGAHIISITSSVGGEGKTTICANLGGIISLTKKKTIILNLDMRKPTLHQRFQLSNKVGMSTLLSNHNTLPEVIQHTAYEHLDIISSGPVPPNPSELIQGQRMVEVLELLRKVYDVIILDTPPVGLVADAQILMRLSDATIYIMRAGETKKIALGHIEKIAEGGHIHGLGIVLNAVDMKKHGYGYGYGYGYYEEKK